MQFGVAFSTCPLLTILDQTSGSHDGAGKLGTIALTSRDIGAPMACEAATDRRAGSYEFVGYWTPAT
jgi:hypothetical protein